MTDIGKPMTNLLSILSESDMILTERVKVAGKDPTCRTGCAHCCYHLVPATLPEVILALVKAVSSGHQKLVTRMDKARKNAKRARGLKGDNNAWRKLHRPCMFLTKSNRCAAYDARPIVCRTFVSFDDPVKCRDGKMFESSDAPAVAAEQLSEELRLIAENLDMPTERRTIQEWLPAAMAWLGQYQQGDES